MSVLALLSVVAGYLRLPSQIGKVDIDGVVFKAHYKITTAILVGCSVLVTAHGLIGDPINCITDGANPDNVINTYCWISFTFTLPEKIEKDLPAPGVASYTEEDKEENKFRYHSYYQWVPFMLFFQGIMFYVPHWLWKIWEGGYMRLITEKIRDNPVAERPNCQRLVKYLIESLQFHNVYAAVYYLCEILNFLNVIGNIILIDKFLGGEFFSYGIKVFEFSQMEQEDRSDPMICIFPRVTKCTFHKYGPSGTIQSHDALCILALNVLNEKIYIFLWFWLILLTVVTGVSLLYSFSLMIPSIRKKILLRRYKFGTPDSVSMLISKMEMSDVMFFDLLGQNMNMLEFDHVMGKLSSCLRRGYNHLTPSRPSGTIRLPQVTPPDNPVNQSGIHED